MLVVIEDEATIEACEEELKAQVERVTTEAKLHIVGFPGGTAEATIYYVESLNFWMTFERFSGRFWNCGGLGYPFSSATPTPQVEINPALSGIDRRVAGAFLIDEDGVRYIGHNGKVGGGAKGVSKTNFLAYSPEWLWVMSGDKMVPMYVIGRLDDDKLPRKLRDFTRTSADFRALIKSGKLTGTPQHPAAPCFSNEFEGSETYQTADLVEANSTHGVVVKALREALGERGIEAFNTVNRDLYVLDADSEVKTLFEVRSNAEVSDIYTVLGQLMFHGGAGVAQKLVAVLPSNVGESVEQRLNKVGIDVITFDIDSDGAVSFENLDSVSISKGN